MKKLANGSIYEGNCNKLSEKHGFGKLTYLNGNNYHPNEISADMLAGMLLGEKSKSRAHDKLLEWWEQLLIK